MDDDDGMESFTINDSDLDHALNPRRFFQSKEQATYGIWADSDDEEDNNARRSGRNDRRVDGGRKPDYKAPVNFVSGGFKPGSGPGNENSEKKEDGSGDKEDDEPIELNSFGTARKGFGSGGGFAPSAPPPKKRNVGANVMAGMRVSSSGSAPDPNKLADWTKHSKGSVIHNMMAKMGYQHGKGLGKDSQGIVEPVQAAVRAGRGAVGAYGREATGPKFGESAADAQRRIDAEIAGGGAPPAAGDEVRPLPKGAWKKNARVKTTFRTMDDVIKEGGSIGHRAANASGEKVIDMTGPEQRVYTGYDALRMQTVSGDPNVDSSEKEFDIPELSHNLNLLIDLTEEEIRRTNHHAKTLEDQTTALQYDLTHLRDELQSEEDELQRMKEVHDLLESLHNSKSSMEEMKAAFCRLRSDYSAEYALFELDKVAVTAIMPQITKQFAAWRPLEAEQRDFGYDLMKEWRDILAPPDRAHIFSATNSRGGGENGLVNDKLAAFDRLMWDGWMPPVRSAILRWDPRDELEVMMSLVEAWLPLIPLWMRDKFIEQLLIPRITARVEEWDPLRDEIPVHQWLVPWMELMGDRLVPVFAPIRQKLARALKLWQADDSSALTILQPWRDVWTPATMAAFTSQNIVPKLRTALMEMNLDPAPNKLYAAFEACLGWMRPVGLISPDIVADLLVTNFFPRWLDTLYFWLDSPSVVMLEVRTWLQEWNGRFPPILMAIPAVKECLRRGLLALAGQRLPTGTSLPPGPGVPPPPPSSAAPPFAMPPPPKMAPEAQLSLKDVLEMTAARQGITYVPQQNRYKEGKQVYWFGTLSIYVDRGLVFVFDTTTCEWSPWPIDRLLEAANP